MFLKNPFTLSNILETLSVTGLKISPKESKTPLNWSSPNNPNVKNSNIPPK